MSRTAASSHVTARAPLEIGESGHDRPRRDPPRLHRFGRGRSVGIGARVIDGAVVGEGALIGAGSLVVPDCVIPPGVLALWAPARVVRPGWADGRERAHVETADRYVVYSRCLSGR